MGRAEKYKPKQVAAALEAAGGLINLAAEKLGCDWHTVKRYIDEYEDVAAAYDAANELQLDLSEGMLFRLRDEAESETVRIRAAEFHLNKKGRRRGYGDRMDVTSADEKFETFIVTINHPDKPD